jgi:hypothetical protein
VSVLRHDDSDHGAALPTLHIGARITGLTLVRLSWALLIWSGLVAFVSSTWLLMALRRVGATRFLPRAYWSCALFGSTRDSALVAAGLVRSLTMIAVIPFIYAFAFAYVERAEALTGLVFGLVHGLVAGLALPFAARRCAGALPPGVMGWNLGRLTPLVLLLVHAVYGTLLGYIYVNG